LIVAATTLASSLASNALRWFLLFELALLAGSAPFWLLAGAIEVRRGNVSNLKDTLGRLLWRRDPRPVQRPTIGGTDTTQAPPSRAEARAQQEAGNGPPVAQPARNTSETPGEISITPHPFGPPDLPPTESESGDVRERRISQAKAQRLLREALPALSTLPESHYYAFEGLITEEAGAIDQLVIGLDGVTVVHARPEPGYVLRRADGSLLFSTDAIPDYGAGSVRGNFAEFDEDLDELIESQAADLQTTLPDPGAPVFTLLCFPNAQALTSEGGATGFVSVLDLVEVVSYQGDAAPEGVARGNALTPELVDQLARAVGAAYARDPWLLPSGPAPGPFVNGGP
jgi:hypothetical protein